MYVDVKRGEPPCLLTDLDNLGPLTFLQLQVLTLLSAYCLIPNVKRTNYVTLRKGQQPWLVSHFYWNAGKLTLRLHVDHRNKPMSLLLKMVIVWLTTRHSQDSEKSDEFGRDIWLVVRSYARVWRTRLEVTDFSYLESTVEISRNLVEITEISWQISRRQVILRLLQL